MWKEEWKYRLSCRSVCWGNGLELGYRYEFSCFFISKLRHVIVSITVLILFHALLIVCLYKYVCRLCVTWHLHEGRWLEIPFLYAPLSRSAFPFAFWLLQTSWTSSLVYKRSRTSCVHCACDIGQSRLGMQCIYCMYGTRCLPYWTCTHAHSKEPTWLTGLHDSPQLLHRCSWHSLGNFHRHNQVDTNPMVNSFSSSVWAFSIFHYCSRSRTHARTYVCVMHTVDFYHSTSCYYTVFAYTLSCIRLLLIPSYSYFVCVRACLCVCARVDLLFLLPLTQWLVQCHPAGQVGWPAPASWHITWPQHSLFAAQAS